MSMSPADYAIIAGCGIAGLVALGGVSAYFHRTTRAIETECYAKITKCKDEMEARHVIDLRRVEDTLAEERLERRRELDKMEQTVRGFADVASAVVAIGKSVEHVAERQNDHQQQYRQDMSELKESIRTIETRLMNDKH